jgi:hypothetical protein
MPDEQVHIVVRKPLADIEEEIRRKYDVRSALADVAIEQEALVFTFDGHPRSEDRSAVSRSVTKQEPIAGPVIRKRRKHRIRNRMKTRGWDVVAKFANSRGQSCTIYRPFYDALSSQKLKKREAFAAVRDILKANGNNPKPSSIEYFLENTLEYLASKSSPAAAPSTDKGSNK